eukprot:CAMPEP_0172534668 /NCGR_PEP_ID=MMETSP1067-20121228/6946_1 /TAXON_ID=265564 ORGANISM="Thalassiosira punctigera, Strain Tpunct2005C2" /NCGR_SAMPLE_ID=MMETSP1067 /ASSEMBLY_ACC=CAM_ASM_000444 /LENGTH=390 /DNA_ID=CAMNT_0013319483 /DNA_START=262 /DNA_END=1434 /DNA_ORIENTATION=+
METKDHSSDKNGPLCPSSSPPSTEKAEERTSTSLSATSPSGASADAAAAADDGDDNKGQQEQEATFPQQLMDVIEGESKEGGAMVNGERVLEWLPSGDSFIIRDKAAFEKRVLPRYFNAKCKFMSFVRKLYRWGFRQVEKSSPGIMTFTHPNFHRGDKQRCMKMRSIVKKQTAHPVQPLRLAGMGVDPRLQAFGLAGTYEAMMGQAGLMGNAAALAAAQHSLAHQVPRQMYPPSFNQGVVGDGLMNSMNTMNHGGCVGLGGPASMFSSVSSQYPRAGAMGGMTSTDMFEAGLRLEEMEQRQQQRQMQMMGMLNGGGNTAMLNGGGSPALSPFNPVPPSHMPNASNFGGSVGGSMHCMSEMELASEIMKRGEPGMEPWRALELAKRYNNAK